MWDEQEQFFKYLPKNLLWLIVAGGLIIVGLGIWSQNFAPFRIYLWFLLILAAIILTWCALVLGISQTMRVIAHTFKRRADFLRPNHQTDGPVQYANVREKLEGSGAGDLLKEMQSVKQEVPGELTRWFASNYFDLFVWSGRNGEITGFQLCYDKPNKERAVTWIAESGFSHRQVDPGGQDPRKNRSPILLPDGLVPFQTLAVRFTQSSEAMDQKVARFVMSKLNEYALRGEVRRP